VSTDAGYSGTPLARKLGLNAGQRVLFEDPPGDGWVACPTLVIRREAR
jgi:hypothetical protein